MSTKPERIIGTLKLDSFFDEGALHCDLREGMVWNQAKTRLCLLSTDLLAGVYKALVDEAGPAWSLILKNCGTMWGVRVMRRLDREMQLLLGQRLSEIPLGDFLAFITDYFAFHGWGIVELDLSRTQESGIVEARLTHSIFAEIVSDAEEMADPMIAGILGAMISYLSGSKLDCEQTECITKGAPCSRFVITDPTRLKKVPTMIESGLNHEQVLNAI